MNTQNLTFIDLISIISFVIALQNLDYNITQDDLQNIAAQTDKHQSEGIDDIHRHLDIQDKKIDRILEELKNGRRSV